MKRLLTFLLLSFVCLCLGGVSLYANQITLDSATTPQIYYPHAGVARVVDPALTVVDYPNSTYGTMLGAFVVIESGKQTGDSLAVTNANGLSWSYNSNNGRLTITGSGSSATYQAVLRSVTFSSATSQTGTTRTIRFILGHQYPYFDSSFSNYDTNYSTPGAVPHFYQKMGTASNSRTAMSNSNGTYRYLGLQGYLLTLTSSAENTYVNNFTSNATWLGANDNWNGDSSEGQWRWVTGPEGVAQRGIAKPSTAANYSNWKSGEPNNSNNEDYVARPGGGGGWNDRDDDVSHYNVFEYGGMSGDPRVLVDKALHINTRPTVTLSADSPIYVTGVGRSLYVDALVTVTGGNIRGATVTLTNVKSGDSLSVTPQHGITGSYASGTGVLTLTGYNKTVAEYQAVLRTLVYTNSLSSPDLTARTVRYALTDTGLTQDRVITMQVQSAISKNGTSTSTVYGPDAFVVDASISVTGPSLNGAFVKITSGFVAGQDVLAATNVGSLVGSYNSSTGLLTITGSGTAAEYQTMLRSVTYRNSSASPTYGTREIKFVLGNVLPNFSNGHFYSIVTVSGTKLLWDESRIRSLEKSYLGHQGYLATITNATEMSHINGLGITAALWLGGNDVSVEGTWRWVAGPEGLDNSGAGRQFWSGLGLASGGTLAGPDLYANWNGTVEPNNAAGLEDYLQLYTDGTWNDLPGTSYLDYLIEYGGMPGDPVTTVVKNMTFSETTNMDLSITNNIFIASVGGSGAGKSVSVDAGMVVDGATVSGGSVTITGFQTGDFLSVVNQGGITGSYSSGTGVLTLTGSASAANYQAILRSLSYGNTQNSPVTTTRTITYLLTYGVNGETVSKSLTMQIQNPSNLTGTVTNKIYFSTENDWMPLDASMGLSGGNLSDFRFYVPTGADLNYTATGLSAAYASGVLSFSGSATASTYQTAIRTVSIKPNTVGTNFTVNIAVGHLTAPTVTETFGYASVGSDATAATSMAKSKSYYGWRGSVYSLNTGTKTVAVSYTTPEVLYGGPTVLTHSVSFTRYVTPAIAANLTSNVMILKPNLDAPPTPIVVDGMIALTGGTNQESPLRGARVRLVTNYQSGQDTLSATASGSLNVGYSSGTLTISGTGTVAAYEAVMRTVMYTNSANSPNTATRSIRFEIDYGGTDLSTKTLTSDVQVGFVTPNVMSKDGVTTMNYYVESTAVTVDASVAVTGPELHGAFVKITTGFDAGKDELSVTNTGVLTGSYNSGTGLLTISGTGTDAEYQTMLRTVKYRNNSASPSYADRQIVFVLGTILPEFTEGHFYIATANAGTWHQTKVRAEATSYLGYRGYLATITSAAETTHLAGLGLATDVYLGGSDDATEGVWRWRTGPEGLENSGLGRQFWQGSYFGSTTAPDQYANFESGVEPSNTGDSDYLKRLSSTGKWDDVNVNSTAGYLIEYRGFSGEHAVQVQKTVEVRQRPLIQLSTTINTYVKNAGDLILDEQLIVAGYTISSASVQIGAGFDVLVDTLRVTPNVGISASYVTANGLLLLTGNGTSKSYQDTLRTVTYQNSTATPVEGTRNVVFELRFGDNPYFTTSASLNVFTAPVYTMGASVVTANFFSGRGPLPVPTDLTITGGTLSSAMAKIVTNYQSTQDRLAATDMYGITSVFDIPTGVLLFTGVGTAAEYQEVLGTLSYDNIAVSPSPLTKQIQLVLGSKLPETHNLHFYTGNAYTTLPSIPQEWGPTTREHTYVSPSALSWDQARFWASTRAYFGWKGYLSTVTSLAEAQTVGSLITGEAWLGATDRTTQNSWRWVTGPEGLESAGLGRLFSNSGTAAGGYFTYWVSGQPSGTSGEDYLHMVYNYPSAGNRNQWTDLSVNGVGPVYLPKQFVSEYGGFSGESTFWVQIPVKVFGSNHTIFFGTMF